MLFADYWVARPITYLSGERVDAAVYSGPVGFPELQAKAERAAHPDWLFVSGDPEIATFEALMRASRISAHASTLDGYELFTDLSQPLRPADLAALRG